MESPSTSRTRCLGVSIFGSSFHGGPGSGDLWDSPAVHQLLQCQSIPLDGSIGEQEPSGSWQEGAGLG
jgi:hypothetical protein